MSRILAKVETLEGKVETLNFRSEAALIQYQEFVVKERAEGRSLTKAAVKMRKQRKRKAVCEHFWKWRLCNGIQLWSPLRKHGVTLKMLEQVRVKSVEKDFSEFARLYPDRAEAVTEIPAGSTDCAD